VLCVFKVAEQVKDENLKLGVELNATTTPPAQPDTMLQTPYCETQIRFTNLYVDASVERNTLQKQPDKVSFTQQIGRNTSHTTTSMSFPNATFVS
jgi:hypothetical protein